MEIFKIFINNIQQFYSELERNGQEIEELLSRAIKPCSSITNQCLILTSLSGKDSLAGTGLQQLPNFKILLYNCIYSSVQKELNLLLFIRDEIKTASNNILKKHKSLQKSYCEVRKCDLDLSLILNPCCPRLEHIVDWSLNAWRYYHSLYLQISMAVENIKFENQETVKLLVDSFKEDVELKQDLIKIKSFKLHKFQFIE